MSTAKKNGKMEDVQASLQALITQGKKEGMIRDTDLNAVLSKMNLSPEKIEEVYDRFEAPTRLLKHELNMYSRRHANMDWERP